MWSHWCPTPRKKETKNQRALWCYNARSATNHTADFLLIIKQCIELMFAGINVFGLTQTYFSPSIVRIKMSSEKGNIICQRASKS